MSAREREFKFLQDRGGLRRRLGRGLRQHQLLELLRDVVAGLDLVERNAAIDRLAHQGVVIGYGGGEGIAQRSEERRVGKECRL